MALVVSILDGQQKCWSHRCRCFVPEATGGSNSKKNPRSRSHHIDHQLIRDDVVEAVVPAANLDLGGCNDRTVGSGSGSVGESLLDPALRNFLGMVCLFYCAAVLGGSVQETSQMVRIGGGTFTMGTDDESATDGRTDGLTRPVQFPLPLLL